MRESGRGGNAGLSTGLGERIQALPLHGMSTVGFVHIPFVRLKFSPIPSLLNAFFFFNYERATYFNEAISLRNFEGKT